MLRAEEATETAFPGLPLTRLALAFARDRHAGQRRDADGGPFVLHPVEVASMLRDAGYADHVVAAGMLHEVLEDTDAERTELEQRFGREVAELVASLSDDPGIEDPQERRAALRLQVAEAGPTASAVFAADKVSKARAAAKGVPRPGRRRGAREARALRGEPRHAVGGAAPP